MARRMALIPEELVSSYQFQKPELRVEDEISNLLDRKQLTDSAKVKLLSHLITRFHQTVHAPKPPIPVKVENEAVVETPTESVERTAPDIESEILRDIISSVPPTSARFVSPIAEKLKTRDYTWNEFGEFAEGGQPLKGSNVVDLFSYLLRNSKSEKPPREFSKFWKAIKEVNIPRRWIVNRKLLDDTTSEEEEHLSAPVFPKIPTYKKNRAEKQTWSHL